MYRRSLFSYRSGGGGAKLSYKWRAAHPPWYTYSYVDASFYPVPWRGVRRYFASPGYIPPRWGGGGVQPRSRIVRFTARGY